MLYSLAILALVAIVNANPVAFPQAVTEKIYPAGTAPPGCKPTLDFSFRIAIADVGTTTKQAKRAEASTTSCAPLTVAHVSQIDDGQIQGAIKYVTLLSVNQTGSCQLAPATNYINGTLQAPILNTVPTSTPTPLPAPSPSTTTSVPIVVAATVTPRPSSPTVTSVPTTTSQPPPPTSTSSTPAPVASSSRLSSVSSSSTSSSTSVSSSSTSSSVVIPPTPSSAVESDTSSDWHPLVICDEPGALAITLADGVLKDQQGRVGYIAANYQFQFDGPPQAGAIITAGFSICNNGSLALGGSNVFYKCLSGTFYNLYDRSWAAQCSPVTLNTLKLKTCT